jgi:monofunctional biosynthetic peptidoglycan transglycosylase
MSNHSYSPAVVMTFHLKKTAKKIFLWIRNIFLFFFTLSLFLVVLYKYIPVYYTASMFSRNINDCFRKDKTPVEHHWVPLSKISPALIQAVIASEDNLFLIHNGFDFDRSKINPGEISRSRYKWRSGTLSQQTATTVFYMPSSGNLNKIMNTYFTILIEFVWGKERILEVYLNSIEFGDGIFGAEAIAKKNFHVPAIELTVQEAALITVSISAPKELDSANPSVYMLRRQAKIIGLMDKIIPVEFEKSK